MRALPSATAVLAHGATAPVVLAGEPHKLKGHLLLHNRHPQRVVVRDALLQPLSPELERSLQGAVGTRAAKAATPARLAIGERTLPVNLLAVLAPDQRSRARVKVALDRHTPPGVYHAEIRVGDQLVPVELHVAESLRLDLTPAELIVENRPGGRQHKQVVLHNGGNVPLTIGNIGAVVLDDELAECKTIRAMLAADDLERRSVGDWLSAYLRHGRQQLDGTGMLWVDAQDAPFELAPGETRTVELAIRVPDSLDPRSRYRGVAFLYDQSLAFTVAPIGLTGRAKVPPPSPAPLRARAPAAGRKRSPR